MPSKSAKKAKPSSSASVLPAQEPKKPEATLDASSLAANENLAPEIPLASAIYPRAQAFLESISPRWKELVDAVGPIEHKTRPGLELWEELIRAVAFQQLRASAAEAILGRFRALAQGPVGASGLPGAEEIASMPMEALRSCGFSESKATAILGIAQATLDGSIPSREAAMAMSDDELVAALVPLRGVGRWTVEMLLIYSLERMDIWPADDFGVREGWRFLHGEAQLPPPARLRASADALKPYRTLASWYLWRASMMPGYAKREPAEPKSIAKKAAKIEPTAKKNLARATPAKAPARRKDKAS